MKRGDISTKRSPQVINIALGSEILGHSSGIGLVNIQLIQWG